MAQVTMYTSPICPYCVKAKQLLKQKGIEQIEELDISKDDSAREKMMERSGGRRTVPQIFINGAHVGGCDDLYALDRDGKLDPLLAQ
jgi:glutaredoxin 3